MHQKYWIITAVFITCLIACNKTATPESQTILQFDNPSNFPAPVYDLSANPPTQAGFELGRKLFYEPRLSRNNTITCGSCHIQSSAFTQHGHDVSHGIDDRLGARNSQPIMNLAWNKTFMWDGGIFNLDLQPVAPITNVVEMDETIANVIAKLKARPEYPPMFAKAFGKNDITTAGIMKALSQFMVMCVSSNSKYDSVMRKEAGKTFTAIEQEGYNLVKKKCGNCHAEPLFTDQSFRNNGLAIGSNNDVGRYDITLSTTDRYKFAVPSLRNLAYTAPYMHDGRFYSLDAVLDHYSNHVQKTPNLDPILQQNDNIGIPMTTAERVAIAAFLNTLNDKVFVTDKRLSEQ